MKKLLFISFILIFFTAFSCRETKKYSKCLKTSFYSDIKTLDTRKAGDYISSQVFFMLYRGLMHYTSDNKLVCSLAKNYEISKDQKKYTFYLKDVFWSDGHSITAFDFEISWKKILEPNFPSLYCELLYPIKNAEIAKKGKISIDEVKIKALNAKTLEIELEYPNPYFLFLTSLYTYFPMPSHKEMVFSGPFKIKKWNKNSKILLEKNIKFYNQENIKLDSIQINITPNEETAFQLYENNEIDFLSSFLSPLSIETLGKIRNRKDIKIEPIAGFSYITFNTKKFPFNNKNLRKAFSLAINKKEIVDNITQLKEDIASNCIPTQFLPQKTKVLNHDIALAQKLFNQALKELNITKNQLKISFSLGSYIIHKKEAEAMQQMWKQAFDVSVKLSLFEDKVFLSKLHNQDYQIGLGRLIVRYNDPISIFERYKSKNHPKNFSGWENKEFIAFLDEAKKEINVEKRLATIQKAEKVFLEETPIFPLYFYNYLLLKNPNIKGLYTNIVGDLLFDEIN